MKAFRFKTRAEQRLGWLQKQQAIRRLTNDEWREVSRCEHAIYCRQRKRVAA